jgi:hypothetical protein
MSWGVAEIGLVVVLGLVVVGLVLASLARRLDRLHRRVVRSRATLEAQLVHRADAAADLAAAGVLDPASSVVVGEAAWRAGVRAPRLVGEPDAGSELGDAAAERGLVESQLSQTLRTALGTAQDREEIVSGEQGRVLVERLATSAYRVQLARRFHNDAVVAATALRGNPVVRTFRLAGRAPMPVTVELDDDIGPGAVGSAGASGPG